MSHPIDDSGTDNLDHRMRAADPAPAAHPLLPSGRSLAELLEATMSTDQTDHEPVPSTTTPRSWRLLAVAAVVAATLLGGGIYLLNRPDPAHRTAASGPHKTVLTLSLPTPAAGGPGMNSCIQFSADTLAPMQVAFSGTVTSADAGAVLLSVDHWYKGGTADEVSLTAPDRSPGITSEGSVDLVQDHRYLVTANDGVVSTCGFTLEWTADAAATFEAAFAG